MKDITKNLLLYLFIILVFNSCYTVPKSSKEKILDDMYPILTDEQYKTLDSLSNSEDITKYLDNFWENIDSAFGSNDNGIRAEYSRRLEYANENFPDRLGWGRSDRKRIYVLYGPPSIIDRSEYAGLEVGPLETIKSVEIWQYLRPGKYSSEMLFIFADFEGFGIYTILYSSEDYSDIDVRTINLLYEDEKNSLIK